MSKIVLLTALLLNLLYSKNFTVSTYNVENLFDLENNKTEYFEYRINNKTNWNKKNFKIKLKNSIDIIRKIDADIIALQEIENRNILETLQNKLPKYKYISFSKYNNSAIGLGFLSKIKIVSSNNIDVNFYRRVYRPILETTFKIDNIEFKIFNNHWPSKRVDESYRIKYAKRLFDRVKQLPKDYDYIILGDLNSNYNEYQTFKYDKKLNTTDSITGINHILNTHLDGEFNTYDDFMKKRKRSHLNLWLELDINSRYSSSYRNQYITPDNIILPQALFDNKKLSYIKKSFMVYKDENIINNSKIYRWQVNYKDKKNYHKGVGYSDHLPLKASFSTNKNYRNSLEDNIINQNKQEFKISYLYSKEKLIDSIILKDVIVIYKNNNSAIIKQRNNRAIYLYKNAKNLKKGFMYDLKVNQIKDYNGLKEIENFEIVKEYGKYKNYKQLYLEGNDINILDAKFQNEIIKNMNFTVKRKRLYFNKNDYIYMYAKDESDLPKSNTKIEVKSGHLGVYRGKKQIIFYNKSDYEYR
ncbi:MAG: endonuclease/exonuclease/phosphatase family protein [Campylobacterota bacterium]